MTSDSDNLLGSSSHFNFVVGSALSSWNNVEESLGDVFCAIFGGINNHAARAAYSAVVAFNARLAMVHAAAIVALHGFDLMTEWKSLYKETSTKSQARNDITHFSRVVTKNKDGSEIIYALPSFWKPGWGAAMDGAGKRYDASQIWSLGQEFGVLAIRLHTLAKRIERPPTTPPEASP